MNQSSKPQSPRKRAGKTSSRSGLNSFQGFPTPPRSPVPAEPMFHWVDVTKMFEGKKITPNRFDLFGDDDDESPPKAREKCCRFFHKDMFCSLGFNCPDLHGIFGIQDWAPLPEPEPEPEPVRRRLTGSKRKANSFSDKASGSKRQT